MGTITELIQNMQLANNVAAATIINNMLTITRETTELCVIIEQMKHKQANYAFATWQPIQPPQYTPIQPYKPSPPTYGMGPPQPAYTAYTAPPVPAYIRGPPPPPTQQPFQQLDQPTYQQNHGGRGRGHDK